MSDSNTSTRLASLDAQAPHIETGAVKLAAAVPKNAHQTSGRHAAITNNLNSWSSYKSWAQTIRGTWDDKR